MALEFDHAFVFVGAGAPDADILVAAGMVEGALNIHPGQGTQNRRFFFFNRHDRAHLGALRGRSQQRFHCPGAATGALPAQNDWRLPFRNWSFE
ncbi:MAG: hypothetical protein PVH37_26025 [Desulfobacterales bacterium]